MVCACAQVLEKSLAKSLDYKSRMEAAEASLKVKSTKLDEQAVRLVRTLAETEAAEVRPVPGARTQRTFCRSVRVRRDGRTEALLETVCCWG